MGSKKKNSFVNSALIFAVSGMIIKVMGALNKIILGRKSFLGIEGSPYIGFVYPYFNLFLAIAVAGIPAAVAKIISEHYAKDEIKEKETVFKVMRKFMIFLGFLLGIIFYIITPYISNSLDSGVILSMRSINIAIFIIPYMATYRGYFQGHGNLKPFAGSQILEQFGRVVLGILFAYLLLPKGIVYASAGSLLGVSLGAVFAIILLIFCFLSFRSNYNLPKPKRLTYKESLPIIKRVLYYAIPMTIGASVVPLTDMIDGQMVTPRLMSIGFTKSAAKALYACHSYYSASIINFPIIIFLSIQVSILPVVSMLVTLKDNKALGETIRTALKLTFLISLPSAVGIFVLAKPVLMLLWPSLTEIHLQTSYILKIMSIELIFVSIYQCTSGILQGMSLHIRNAANMFTGAVFKGVISFFLLGIPFFGILGASISSLIAFFIAGVLNMITLKKRTSVSFNFLKIFTKPFIASIIMGVVVYYVYKISFEFVPNSIATILAVIVGMAIYFILIIIFKFLDKEDLQFLPAKKFFSKFVK